MKDMEALGQELINMGQKMLDSKKGSTSHEDDSDEKEEKSSKQDMPKKALIIASLKRKMG